MGTHLRTFVAAAAAIAALAIHTPSAEAQTTIPQSAWDEATYDHIERVYPGDSGFIIVLSENTYQGHTASCDQGRQFTLFTSDPNYEAKSRTLLAAFLAGREVMIYWDTSDSCRAHINRFQVR